ncbi:hypothetical protein ACSTIN_12915 [Vibrio parahaemolyticus]
MSFFKSARENEVLSRCTNTPAKLNKLLSSFYYHVKVVANEQELIELESRFGSLHRAEIMRAAELPVAEAIEQLGLIVAYKQRGRI